MQNITSIVELESADQVAELPIDMLALVGGGEGILILL
jgi:hypothetical protein